MRAPINVVKALIDRGASSKSDLSAGSHASFSDAYPRLPGTLRTHSANSYFTRRNLTAKDIALEMNHSQLVPILTPVIHHRVPSQTLAHLQASFHAMIKADWKPASDMVLPELEALTELNVPEMWFPVRYKSLNEQVVSSLWSAFLNVARHGSY